MKGFDRKLAVIGSGNIEKSIDDKEAKSKVADLITKMGFDSVEAGALKAARSLEPMALLNIGLGYGLGHGTSIGFSFLR